MNCHCVYYSVNSSRTASVAVEVKTHVKFILVIVFRKIAGPEKLATTILPYILLFQFSALK